MKKFNIYIVLVLILSMFLACAESFPVGYSDIDDSKNRVISVTTVNPELAPGDTAVIEMFFAGEAINPNYQCSLALDVHTTIYGDEVDGKVVDIDKYRVVNPTYPDVTSKYYLRFSFVIPDSIFYYSKSIADYPFAMGEDYLVSQFPDNLKKMKKEEFIPYATDMLENYDFAGADEETILMGNLFAQMLSAKMRLKMYVNGNETRKSLSVRLHKRMKNNPLIHPNRNPNIRWIKLFTVKDDGVEKPYFDPNEDDREFSYFYLYADSYTLASDVTAKRDSVIHVEDGYFYYIQADSGVSARDVNGTKDLSTSMGGVESEEFWITGFVGQQYLSQYQDVEGDDKVGFDDNTTFFEITPPKTDKIPYADIWCVVRDMSMGERFRPMGEAMKKCRIYFK